MWRMWGLTQKKKFEAWVRLELLVWVNMDHLGATVASIDLCFSRCLWAATVVVRVSRRLACVASSLRGYAHLQRKLLIVRVLLLKGLTRHTA